MSASASGGQTSPSLNGKVPKGITPPSGHPPWLNPSEAPVLSGDGRVVAFLSRQPVSADDERSHFNLYVVRSDTQAISGSGP